MSEDASCVVRHFDTVTLGIQQITEIEHFDWNQFDQSSHYNGKETMITIIEKDSDDDDGHDDDDDDTGDNRYA